MFTSIIIFKNVISVSICFVANFCLQVVFGVIVGVV